MSLINGRVTCIAEETDETEPHGKHWKNVHIDSVWNGDDTVRQYGVCPNCLTGEMNGGRY